MTWKVRFFGQRLKAGILALPAGLVARFLIYAERMELYGPDLGMPTPVRWDKEVKNG